MAFIGDSISQDWRNAANNFLITAGALTLYQKTAAPYFEELGGESELARTFRAAALVVGIEEARNMLKRAGFNVAIF